MAIRETEASYKDKWLNEMRKKFILLNAFEKCLKPNRSEKFILKTLKVAQKRYHDVVFKHFPGQFHEEILQADDHSIARLIKKKQETSDDDQ